MAVVPRGAPWSVLGRTYSGVRLSHAISPGVPLQVVEGAEQQTADVLVAAEQAVRHRQHLAPRRFAASSIEAP